jgi:hypothetical protein
MTIIIVITDAADNIDRKFVKLRILLALSLSLFLYWAIYFVSVPPMENPAKNPNNKSEL